jgi:hypothetical protein
MRELVYMGSSFCQNLLAFVQCLWHLSESQACELPLGCLDHFARPGSTISSARVHIRNLFAAGAPIRHYRILGSDMHTDSCCRPLIGQKPGVSTSLPRSFERPALLITTGLPTNQHHGQSGIGKQCCRVSSPSLVLLDIYQEQVLTRTMMLSTLTACIVLARRHYMRR